MFIYTYDLFSKDVKEYNRVKRRFYYELKKILDSNLQITWKTKSILVVPDNEEATLDYFFKKYKQWCVVYKFRPETTIQLI